MTTYEIERLVDAAIGGPAVRETPKCSKWQCPGPMTFIANVRADEGDKLQLWQCESCGKMRAL